MRLFFSKGASLIRLSAFGSTCALGLLLLCCALAGNARADEWNDTFSSPREFVVTQNMTARSGPGNSYEPMGILPKGTSVWVTNITNGWHCFKLVDGRSAYIYRRYLKSAQKTGTEKKPAAVKQAKQETPRKKKKAAAEHKARPESPRPQKATPKKEPKQESRAKAAVKSESEATDGDGYDEPIVHEVAPQPEPETQRRESPDPPEPPVLEKIPQGPEDEPEAAAQQSDNTADAAVKPKTRPVRSSSFGTDGCVSYQRVAFEPERTETLLKGKLAPGKRICYRLLAIEGDTLALVLKPADGSVALDVYTPASGHLAEKQTRFSWRCASTGDKIIVVRSEKAASFSLQVQQKK